MQITSLYNSPAFAYLEGNEKAYEDYCNFKNPIGGGDIHTVERFQALIDSVSGNGLRNEWGIVVVNHKNEIEDGQHRACLALKKFGPKHRLKVFKIFYRGKWKERPLNRLNALRCCLLSKITFGDKRRHYLQKCESLKF
jgi:hypothetical protein